MPLAAAMSATLLIGVKTTTQTATLEIKSVFSYAASLPIACRFYDRAARSRTGKFGQTLEVDAIAVVDAATSIDPLGLKTSDGERQQVQITQGPYTAIFEVVNVRDLANLGRVKEIELKRWV
jgi:hypothetical protein